MKSIKETLSNPTFKIGDTVMYRGPGNRNGLFGKEIIVDILPKGGFTGGHIITKDESGLVSSVPGNPKFYRYDPDIS